MLVGRGLFDKSHRRIFPIFHYLAYGELLHINHSFRGKKKKKMLTSLYDLIFYRPFKTEIFILNIFLPVNIILTMFF